jgi:hypothetical protein
MISGYFPNRSELFAPYRAVGVTVVTFHDPVIDGQNQELTDIFEWSRRPGFSKFCPTALGATEIVNQFDSFRNLDGEVVSMYDSNIQLAQFTSAAITPVITKSAGAGQGYVSAVGNLAYFSDGESADYAVWNSTEALSAINPFSFGLAAPTVPPSISATRCWLPQTIFPIESVIQDPNGSIQVVTGVYGSTTRAAGPSTFGNIALAGSLSPSWSASGATQNVVIPGSTTGYTEYLSLTGFGFSIPAGATVVGVTVSLRKETTQLGVFDYSVKLCNGGAVIGSSRASASQWGTASFPTTVYGGSGDGWGASLTHTIVNSSTFGIAISASVTTSHSGTTLIQVGASSTVTPQITVYYVDAGAGSSGLSGNAEPIWSQTLAAPTADGALQWSNQGNLLSWLPLQFYPTPACVLDLNSNIQLATTAANPIPKYNAATAYTVGQTVSFGGTFWTCATNCTGVTPNGNYSTSSSTTSGSTTTGTVTYYWTPATSPLLTGTTAPSWNATVGGTTSDGSYTWTNLGPGSYVEAFGTSYVYGFRTIQGHLTTVSTTSLNTGTIFGPISAAITGFSIVSNVVIFAGTNNFQIGETFSVQNLSTTVGQTLNNQTFVVLAAGLSTTQFEAAFIGPDTSFTVDSGNTLNLIATVMGQGTASPLCNSVVTITASSVTGTVVRLYATNFFAPGVFLNFAGLTVATFLNGGQYQVVNVDTSAAPAWFEVYYTTSLGQPATGYTQTADTGTATFCAVEIYRLSDGGGIFLFAGAVPNPGAGLSFSYADFTIDDDLNILMIAPQNHLNDPPPGAPGSSIPTVGTLTRYWQGRLWMVVGNYVYFNAGPDCTNGVPEQSWPPANRFQFAGPVLNLIPTSDGVGLLVCLADRVNTILGGPETISFYPTDALSNFGISSPNSVFRDGSTIGLFTTQKQYFELIDKQKEEIGQRVANYLTDHFDADTTYVTSHRDGLDVGVFLSNGVDQVIRFGNNVGAWSVPAFPLGGAGALRSIETSVGTYSLMLASPTGGGYLLARDLDSYGDGGTYGQNNGTAYSNCYITMGNITLSTLGAEMQCLQHICIYADAVGDLGTLGDDQGSSAPRIFILPNEVSATTGIGFIELPEIQQEPPTGQNNPSTTMLALRYPINMMNSAAASQFIHSLQVQISWKPEMVKNSLKGISFKADQS